METSRPAMFCRVSRSEGNNNRKPLMTPDWRWLPQLNLGRKARHLHLLRIYEFLHVSVNNDNAFESDGGFKPLTLAQRFT